MLPLFLIIIFSLFVFYSVRFMLKRSDDLHAMAFFGLYIYTIFAQIGYAYFPELSEFYGAYFGPELFYKYWAFMFFSFVFTFLLYRKLNFKNFKKNTYCVKPTNRKYGQYFFFLFIILLYFILNLYFYQYRSLFQYGGGNSMGGPWFGIGFLVFQTCTFILFTLFRDKSNKSKKRIFSLISFLFCFIFLFQVSIASGARSSIIYFFLAIAFYELFPLIKTVKYQKRKIFIILFFSFILFNVLSILRTVRIQSIIEGSDTSVSSIFNYDSSDSKSSGEDLTSAILLQDYYLPSHTLFVSMYYNIIDPIEVAKSNFANSLILFEYPFLTTTILDRGLGIDNERGVGWAYHYFVEGYNALGLFGVFYNALFWNLGMILWVSLAQSNNKRHNTAMFGISALVLVTIVRGQTATFIKFYWLVLLPALVLLLLANNFKLAFYKRK